MSTEVFAVVVAVVVAVVLVVVEMHELGEGRVFGQRQQIQPFDDKAVLNITSLMLCLLPPLVFHHKLVSELRLSCKVGLDGLRGQLRDHHLMREDRIRTQFVLMMVSCGMMFM